MNKDFTALTDKELVDEVCDHVRGAAILSSRGVGYNHHDESCRALYAEAERRGKLELYERGYTAAVGSFGQRG